MEGRGPGRTREARAGFHPHAFGGKKKPTPRACTEKRSNAKWAIRYGEKQAEFLSGRRALHCGGKSFDNHQKQRIHKRKSTKGEKEKNERGFMKMKGDTPKVDLGPPEGGQRGGF